MDLSVFASKILLFFYSFLFFNGFISVCLCVDDRVLCMYVGCRYVRTAGRVRDEEYSPHSTATRIFDMYHGISTFYEESNDYCEFFLSAKHYEVFYEHYDWREMSVFSWNFD